MSFPDTRATRASNISSPAITLRELLDTLFLYKWAIISVFCGVMASSLFLLFFLLSPQYGASTTFLINPSNLVTPVSQAIPLSDFEKITTFHAQKDIVKSGTVVGPVVDRLHLGATRTLGRLEKIKNFMLAIRRRFGLLIGYKPWTKVRDPVAVSVDAVLKHIDIVTSPESNAMKLNYRAYSPDEAALTLNAVLDEYTSYFYQLIKLRASGVIAYLETQLDSIQRAVTENEAALLRFKQHDRIPISGARYSMPMAADSLSLSLLGLTDNNVVQNEIKAHMLILEDELRHLRGQYSETDPRAVEIRGKLREYAKLFNALPGKEVEYWRLRREWELNQDAYILMKKNLLTARTIEAGNTSKINIITVVEKASPDERSISPKKRQMLAISVFLGIALGIVFALLCNFLDHKVKNPRDIERFTSLKVIGSLKKVKC